MGHDISPIGNHKLNTADVTSLAEDICSRMDINVEYGYRGVKAYFKLLGQDRQDENVVLGKIIKDSTFNTFRLYDENYQMKQLLDKFGNNLFSNPDYWRYDYADVPNQEKMDNRLKEVNIPNYDLELLSHGEYATLYIYKDLYMNSITYISRWWSFCSMFTEYDDNDFDLGVKLLPFRRELMDWTVGFGGDKMYYLDDQSKVLKGVGMGDEWDFTWPDFEHFVAEKTAPLLLNIPMFLTDKNYRNAFLEREEYPLSFVDDFKDIR